MAKDIRYGRGKADYKRERLRLRADYIKNNKNCCWCGQPFPWDITDHNHPLYFTADHPVPLAHGGSLVGQELEGYHRSCNASKGNKVIPKGNLPTTDVF